MNRPRLGPQVTLLRWTFRRDGEFLTCRLDRQRNGTFVITVMTHGLRRPDSAEEASSATLAFQLHADTADRLRELGWVVVGYSEQEATAA
jgi:hypothetical protein